MTQCNDRLDVALEGSRTATSARCILEPHAVGTWHQGQRGTRWITRPAKDFCQVEEGEGFLAYTCLKPLPCPDHTDHQAESLGSEGTEDTMGGQAHDADPAAEGTTTTVETPDSKTTVETTSTDDSSEGTASTEAQSSDEATTEASASDGDSSEG